MFFVLEATVKKSYYERNFVERFLACMWQKGITEIPFDDQAFSSGVDAAKAYLQTRGDSFLRQRNLDLLFQKQTTYGEYIRLMDVIHDMNGILVSLQNPHYVSARINMSSELAEYLIDTNETGLSEDDFQGVIEAFSQGAHLTDIRKENGAA
jgi:hypothetical protein